MTTGLGGHTEAMLKACAPDGSVTGLDRDAAALERSAERLKGFGARVRLIKSNYAEAAKRLAGESFNGILADLGVSSMQLLTPERGFSFMSDGPLDMRMDRDEPLTAGDYLRDVEPDELEALLRDAGEERFAKKLTGILKMEAGNLRTTGDLAKLVSRCIPRRGKSHPATRVFMALRLAVNKEMESLKIFLDAAPRLLADGGRLAVISFHSTEDRIVKRFYQDREDMKKVSKSALIPSWDERKRNPRSRSAKLRSFQKI